MDHSDQRICDNCFRGQDGTKDTLKMVVCRERKEKKRAFGNSLTETWDSSIMGVYYTQGKIDSHFIIGFDTEEGGFYDCTKDCHTHIFTST